MQVRDCAVAVIAFSTLSVGTVDAQQLVRVEAGDRVRVQRLSPSGTFEYGETGTVQRVVGDSVLFIDRDGTAQQLRIHAEDYRVRVLAFTGRRSSLVPGVVAGALLGGVGGAVIGVGSAEDCEPPSTVSEPTCIEGGREAVIGGLIGMGGGVVLGIVVGSLVKRDSWTPVRGFPTVEPSFSSPSRAGLGLSLRF